MSYVQDFSDLPDELILEVSKLLHGGDIIKLSKTNKRLNELYQDNNFWYDIVARDTGKILPYNSNIDYKKIYRIQQTILKKYKDLDFLTYFVNTWSNKKDYIYYFVQNLYEKIKDTEEDFSVIPESLSFKNLVSFFKFLSDNSLIVDDKEKELFYELLIGELEDTDKVEIFKGLGKYMYDIIEYEPGLLLKYKFNGTDDKRKDVKLNSKKYRTLSSHNERSNKKNLTHDTFIMEYVRDGNLRLVKYLLDKNKKYITAREQKDYIYEAIKYGQINVLKYFLQNPLFPVDMNNVIHFVVRSKNIGMLKFILQFSISYHDYKYIEESHDIDLSEDPRHKFLYAINSYGKYETLRNAILDKRVTDDFLREGLRKKDHEYTKIILQSPHLSIKELYESYSLIPKDLWDTTFRTSMVKYLLDITSIIRRKDFEADEFRKLLHF